MINTSRGSLAIEATQHDLRDAIEQLLAGENVRTPQTQPVGCLIALPRKSVPHQDQSEITYCDQISRVLQQHCVECHRSGEIGPFALDDYDEIVGWADMMVEVIDEKRMPPWHASPEHGSFANARQMPESDKELIRHWVLSGTPFGDAKDLPKKPEYVTGWRLPKQPDMVFEMHRDAFQGACRRRRRIPVLCRRSRVRRRQVDRRLRRSFPATRRWFTIASPSLRPPDGSGFDGFGLLAAYVPGQLSTTLPPGYARRVAAGSRIVFQMHYTPTGTPQTDKTRIGIVFAEPESVTHEVFVVAGIEQEFEIPPNTALHTVRGKVGRFPKNGYLIGDHASHASAWPIVSIDGKDIRGQ